MRNRFLALALSAVMECIRGADGHDIAKTISTMLTATELEVLAGTVKEAEVRRKEEDERRKRYE